eukprot:15470383-Alexandrium_andersonii.AAC.1
MLVAAVACHCRVHDMVMVIVVATACPKRAQDGNSEFSRGPFCVAVRAEREYGNESLPEARLGPRSGWHFKLNAEV